MGGGLSPGSGIDGLLGTRRWMDIVDVVQSLRKGAHPEPLYHLPEAATVGSDEQGALRAAVQGTSAYLKIADGCRRPCAFCAIPLIKGTAASRPLPAIVAEAQALQGMGIREIVLIARIRRITARFGDEGWAGPVVGGACPQSAACRLAAGDVCIPRLCHRPLVEVMTANKQVLPYLDMPLQHATRMSSAGCAARQTSSGISHPREDAPRHARSGAAHHFYRRYPGESDAEFQSLLDLSARCNSTGLVHSSSPLSREHPAKPWAILSRRR